jgi:hypothetical protein
VKSEANKKRELGRSHVQGMMTLGIPTLEGLVILSWF